MESRGSDSRGKRAALRVLNGEPGGQTAGHPTVTDAEIEADSIWTLWRLAYGMPPNDPRFQDITEEEVLTDLLVRHFHRKNGASEEERLIEHLRDNLSEFDALEKLAEKIPQVRPSKPKAPPTIARRGKKVMP